MSALYKCKICGGDIVPNADGLTGECQYCGSVQTLPKEKDEKLQNLLNRANDFRMACDFDRAIFTYEEALEIDEQEPEAHWGIFLSRYGVEYVKDPQSYEYKPTVHRINSVSVYDDPDYQATLRYSSQLNTEQYKTDAALIESVMKELLRLSADAEEYDVFLSYKEADDATRSRTEDSVLAHDLYAELTARGYKVFFAPKSLGAGLYEPKIYSAIISSKAMIVLGTKEEYFNAVWVKNEWSRFVELIENGEDRIIIPVYKIMNADRLPNRLAKYQALNMSDMSFLTKLTDILAKNIDNKEAPAVSDSENNCVERGFLALEDGDFSKADSYFESALDQNPHNSQAYFGKLMAEMRIRDTKQIITSAKPLKEYKNFEKAVRFADQKQKATFLSYEEKVNEAINLRTYSLCKKLIDSAASEADYRSAINQLKPIKSYRNSAELIKLCESRISDIKAENEKQRKNEQIRLEKEKTIQEENQKKSKIKRIISLIIAILLVVSIIKGAAVFGPQIVGNYISGRVVAYTEKGKYRKAERRSGLLSDKYLIKAADELVEDGYLKDSVDILDYCKEYPEEKINAAEKTMLKNAKEGDIVYYGSTFVRNENHQMVFESKNSEDAERISWVVLKKEKSKVLLVSENVLSMYNFRDDEGKASWETSVARKYLNDLYETFNNKNMPILSTKHKSGEKEINDKLFLLSEKEAEAYSASDASKGFSLKAKFVTGKTPSSWWLRTIDKNGNPKEINIVGNIVSESKGNSGIRPAMWVSIKD